jgi:hypothetical protein
VTWHGPEHRDVWTVGHDWRGRGSLRPLRPKVGLAALDPALEQPDVKIERDRRDRDRGQEGSADLDGTGVRGDELHGSLHG